MTTPSRSRKTGANDLGEEAIELADDVIGGVFDQEVRGGEAAAPDVGGPRTPHLDDIAVEQLERAARAPQCEHRAADPAPPIGLVVLAIDAGARPIVLADRLHDTGIVELGAVRSHHLGWIPAGLASESDPAQVMLEVRVRSGCDQPLG